MLSRLLLLFLLAFYLAFCSVDSTNKHNSALKICGQVNGRYMSDKLVPVHDATVTVKVNDSVKYSQATDENGHYELDVPRQSVIAKIVVGTSMKTQVKGKKFELFLPGREQYKINLDTSGTVNYNLEVTEGFIDFNFPEFLFKPNSTEFDMDTSITFKSPISAANWYSEFLTEKKPMIMEFTAYSNKNEKNYNELAKLRAEKIKDLLHSKGISLEQIKIKAAVLPSDRIAEAKKYNPSGYSILLRGVTIKILAYYGNEGPEESD
jgi:hypothetical protein